MEFPYKTAMISKEPYGELSDGGQVTRWFLTNRKGMRAEVLDLGATLRALSVKGGDLRRHDVVLGAHDLDEYRTNEWIYAHNRQPEQKGHVGADAEEELSEQFRQKAPLCAADVVSAEMADRHVCLRYQFGDENALWDGLELEVNYAVTEDDELVIGCEAILGANASHDVSLPIFPIPYFNLAGRVAGNVLDHAVALEAARVTPLDSDGEEVFLEGSVLANSILLSECLGGAVASFDRLYAVQQDGDSLETPCATLYCDRSKLFVDVCTNAPFLRLTTFQPAAGRPVLGKGQVVYGNHSALLVSGAYGPHGVLHPGESLSFVTTYRFDPEMPENYVPDSGCLDAIL